MSRRFESLLTILLAAFLAGITISSSVDGAMAELTTRDLAVQSTDVVVAQVMATRAEWNADRNFIFMRVTLRVTERLKGALSAPATITVLVPGGEVDGVGLGVEHAARFNVGEEVIAFLHPIEDSVYGVTGWEQGKFTVERGQVKEKGISVADFREEIRKALK